MLNRIPVELFAWLLAGWSLAGLFCSSTVAESKRQRMYFGTYADGKNAGVFMAELDPATGVVTEPRLAGKGLHPSFLALHPTGRFLYAVGDSSRKGDAGGAVMAFSVDPRSGMLTKLNEQSPRGAGPCHLVVDRAGKDVLVANYTGGTVAVLPIDANGRLKPASDVKQHGGKPGADGKPQVSHAHSINLDKANRFAFAADLGLDQVLVYKFDSAAGKLTPNDSPFVRVAAGSGPRHFAFHPTEKFAYVINETGNTVTAFNYDASRGVLTPIQTLSTLPPGDTTKSYTAEIVVHPTGKFVYGSNRGHDSIAIFAVDESTGRLTAVGHEPTQGKWPRNFAVDPTGKFLFAENQDSDTVVVFRIDSATGKLTATGQVLPVPKPCCIKFLAVDGK